LVIKLGVIFAGAGCVSS